jgi:hypothetical protein
MKFVSALAIALSSFIYATSANAQGFSLAANSLDLSASVANPAPGQSVEITARGYGFSIDGANVSWSADGKVIQKGIGLNKATIKAPVQGKHTTISVTATAAGGLTFSNSITIVSGSVDLVVEPDGYVPPLFSGKFPVTYQNSVKIIAVPHLSNSSGVEYDPKSLVYTWKKNSSVLQDQSGYGAQSITLAGSEVPRPFMVEVNVSTRDSSARTSALVSINLASPVVTFYKNDSLYGPLFNNALGSLFYLGSEREAGLLAVPYGFNLPSNGTRGLAYTWAINGTRHPELSSNDSITARSPDEGAGSSNIQVTINNADDILQGATAAISASWSAVGKQASPAAF